ncbi:hypothetical protein ElyMa_002338200 [Elysia marginata]|uniref:Uncharacterized protein n=1 Tax=Elysia marginata TaxID=1093978 RepID=A0AAV4G884_9GAST|nr:hypothetical protein ElyMa_002338200 [Elysia marginata]
MENRLSQLQKDLTNKTERLENRIVDEISLLRKDFTNKTSYLEDRIISMDRGLGSFMLIMRNNTQAMTMPGDVCSQPLQNDTNYLDNALQKDTSDSVQDPKVI